MLHQFPSPLPVGRRLVLAGSSSLFITHTMPWGIPFGYCQSAHDASGSAAVLFRSRSSVVGPATTPVTHRTCVGGEWTDIVVVGPFQHHCSRTVTAQHKNNQRVGKFPLAIASRLTMPVAPRCHIISFPFVVGVWGGRRPLNTSGLAEQAA